MIEFLFNLLVAGIRVLLVGKPGTAKTARIHAVAARAGYRVVVMRGSTKEAVDFSGAMIPDFGAGVTRLLPLDVLKDLQTTAEPTLLFLDDIGQSPVDTQKAMMGLFDAGNLSPKVIIWGATNRPQDKAGVSALLEPLRSRFDTAYSMACFEDEGTPDNGTVKLGTWSEENASFCAYASDADYPAEVVAWHRATNGRTLHTAKPCAHPGTRFADYRGWEVVAKLWRANLRSLDHIAGAVGKPVAAEFLAFARLAADIPTPDQIWVDPMGANVPTGDDAASKLYLICTMLAQAAQPKFARPLVQYLTRLPPVYAALLGRDVFRRIGGTMTGSKEWINWFTDNQDLFAA